ncbi:hypothetical protein [Sodalis sp. RH16]|uniref:hypothetical protein n=1 Tax=unclassified Sodalis (in: enterobacteria) TaxID=2636512 RepID=UPI0039B4737B
MMDFETLPAGILSTKDALDDGNAYDSALRATAETIIAWLHWHRQYFPNGIFPKRPCQASENGTSPVKQTAMVTASRSFGLSLIFRDYLCKKTPFYPAKADLHHIFAKIIPLRSFFDYSS